MPRPISSTVIGCIPFAKIGQLVGFGIAVYGYSQVIIVGYRYGQQFLSKFKSKRTKNRKSNLIKKQAMFVIVRIQRIISKTPTKGQRYILFCTA
jgi:hypothetical protein